MPFNHQKSPSQRTSCISLQQQTCEMELKLLRLRDQIEAERKQRQKQLEQAHIDGCLWSTSAAARRMTKHHVFGRGNITLESSKRCLDRLHPTHEPTHKGKGGSATSRLHSHIAAGREIAKQCDQAARQDSEVSTNMQDNRQHSVMISHASDGSGRTGSIDVNQPMHVTSEPPQHELKTPHVQQNRLADGCFNEVEAQLSFQEAVASWRGGRADLSDRREALREKPAVKPVSDGHVGTSTSTMVLPGPRLSLFRQIQLRHDAWQAASKASQQSRCSLNPDASRHGSITTPHGFAASAAASLRSSGASLNARDQSDACCRGNTKPSAEHLNQEVASLLIHGYSEIGGERHEAGRLSVDAHSSTGEEFAMHARHEDGTESDEDVVILSVENADALEALTSQVRLPDAIILP
jgi:hypothetical protein